MTDCTIRSRIDPLIKAEAVALFEHMGLTLSEAIRLFLYQSVAEKRIPFSINIPNAKTRATLEKANRGQDLEPTTLEQLGKAWDEACEK
jgi:DNA-damage-inducible protein J